jgi:hypothetical protein
MTDNTTSDSLGSPDGTRGGPDLDAAVADAESDSQVEGVHMSSGDEASGDSQLEQMREVDTTSDHVRPRRPRRPRPRGHSEATRSRTITRGRRLGWSATDRRSAHLRSGGRW